LFVEKPRSLFVVILGPTGIKVAAMQ